MTGTLTYFGSPSATAKARTVADHEAQRLDFAVRKEILWESDTATKAEAREIEVKMIRELGANNPTHVG